MRKENTESRIGWNTAGFKEQALVKVYSRGNNQSIQVYSGPRNPDISLSYALS